MPRILWEDNHLIAAFKQSGQTVQTEPNKPIALEVEVKDYIKEKYQKPGAVYLGVIHRLDMPVEGIVLFAKTSKALVRMNEIFQQRKVRKIYQAWVHGKPPATQGNLLHWLKRDEHKNYTKAYQTEVKNSERAELNYRLIQSKKGYSLLEVELLSGRKHQIRVQLSSMGCPIMGDKKYGALYAYDDHSIALQACELEFIHPVSNENIHVKIENLKFPEL
ncbi:MAG: RNA pseudouridine synthase [Bacteroidia bacterium]|nr:RNA pseudouridine synthase [Bacteroidia bacterium]